jgi:hypothetical protein
MPGQRKPNRKMTADGACAEDADTHGGNVRLGTTTEVLVSTGLPGNATSDVVGVMSRHGKLVGAWAWKTMLYAHLFRMHADRRQISEDLASFPENVRPPRPASHRVGDTGPHLMWLLF